MGRIKVNSYLDIVVTHPEWTQEQLDAYCEEEKEKSKNLTEWEAM